jgi:sugar lactone lactonase YvrE
MANDMPVDSEGRVYAATNSGVEVFSPDGELLGSIAVQWGADKKPLHSETSYIVGAGTVPRYRCDRRVQGMGATARRSHSKGAVGS